MSQDILATNGKFTVANWKKFCSFIKDENESIHLSIDDNLYSSTFSTITTLFMSDEIRNALNNATNNYCIFICNNATLTVDVKDMLWWSEPKNDFKRLNKLCNITTSKPSKQTSTISSSQIKIAAGVLVENRITALELFEGDKKQAVTFINEYYCRQNIRARFDNTKLILFAFNYDDNMDLTDKKYWKTIDELEVEGLVTVS